MREADLGYAAGLMDGEGAIQIVKVKSPSTTTGLRYQLHVTMCNTRRELCQWLGDNFGGSVFQYGKTKAENLLWHWTIKSAKAQAFLVQVHPFLITKRAKADIALEFQAERVRSNSQGMTKHQWERQESQKILLRQTK